MANAFSTWLKYRLSLTDISGPGDDRKPKLVIPLRNPELSGSIGIMTENVLQSLIKPRLGV